MDLVCPSCLTSHLRSRLLCCLLPPRVVCRSLRSAQTFPASRAVGAVDAAGHGEGEAEVDSAGMWIHRAMDLCEEGGEEGEEAGEDEEAGIIPISSSISTERAQQDQTSLS